MTDQTFGLPGVPATGGRLRPVAAHSRGRYQLRPAVVLLLAAFLSAGMLIHFWQDEGYFENILFTLAVTAALIAFLVLLFGRVLFATVAVASVVAMIVAAASVKRATMYMVVHAYDLFFYLGSWSTVSYLWGDQPRYVLA